MKYLPVIIALVLFGCQSKVSTSTSKQFICEKIAEDRSCMLDGTKWYPPTENNPSNYYAQSFAYCYTRSEVEPIDTGFRLQWSHRDLIEQCSPTQDECERVQHSTGNGVLGQPPVKTSCVVKTPNEHTDDVVHKY